MEFVLILILVLLLITVLYFLFNVLKWVFQEKKRIKTLFFLLSICVLGVIVNYSFFRKTQVIQSAVYPNLYLVKYPINNEKGSCNETVKAIIQQRIIDTIKGIKVVSKMNRQLVSELETSLLFYEYYNNWNIAPFTEAGTAHFIKHKEDPGGFTSEELIHYHQYRLAKFQFIQCENDTLNYYGVVDYYKERKVVKTDTIIKLCN